MSATETFREGSDRSVEKFKMIIGVVRAGVPWSLDRGEEFVCFVAPHPERVISEPALVRRRSVLFVGMRSDQCRVEI